MRNLCFLLKDNDGKGLTRSLQLAGNHLEREVVRDHQEVDRKLQLHPAEAEAPVGAQPEGRVARAAMFIARRQIAVDVERIGVGEDVAHVMRRRLDDDDAPPQG